MVALDVYTYVTVVVVFNKKKKKKMIGAKCGEGAVKIRPMVLPVVERHRQRILLYSGRTVRDAERPDWRSKLVILFCRIFCSVSK